MITSLLLHGPEPMEGHGAQSASAIFDLMPEHVPALWAMGLSLVAGLILLQLRQWSVVSGFRHLPLRVRWIAIMVIISGAAHAGLVIGATRSWKVVFGGSALLAVLCVYRMIRGQSGGLLGWKLLAWILLAGSLAGYWIELLRGHQTDQIGLAVKVIEVLGLALLLLPNRIKGAVHRFVSRAAAQPKF